MAAEAQLLAAMELVLNVTCHQASRFRHRDDIKRLFAGMNPFVNPEVKGYCECLFTQSASMSLLGLGNMESHVNRLIFSITSFLG